MVMAKRNRNVDIGVMCYYRRGLLLKAGDTELWNRLTIMGFILARDLVGWWGTTVHAYTPLGGRRIWM